MAAHVRHLEAACSGVAPSFTMPARRAAETPMPALPAPTTTMRCETHKVTDSIESYGATAAFSVHYGVGYTTGTEAERALVADAHLIAQLLSLTLKANSGKHPSQGSGPCALDVIVEAQVRAPANISHQQHSVGKKSTASDFDARRKNNTTTKNGATAGQTSTAMDSRTCTTAGWWQHCLC